MNMVYRLLDNGTGVILTRDPELVKEKISFTFTGAPTNATVVFERNDGESAYRECSTGVIELPVQFLDGSCKVTVVILDGTIRPKKWQCEGILARPQNDGRVLVCPDDMDMQRKIVALQITQSEMKTALVEQIERCAELEGKLNNLLEGYDIV